MEQNHALSMLDIKTVCNHDDATNSNTTVPLVTVSSPLETEFISKNQRKRLQKNEYFKSKKKLKKLESKERKKQKKDLNRKTVTVLTPEIQCPPILEINTSTNTSIQSSLGDTKVMKSRESKEEKKVCFIKACKRNFSVIIDCSFEEYHSEGDLKSLGSQIAFSYGYNRKHIHPCDLHLTGLGQKLSNQLKKSSFEKWLGVDRSNSCYTNIPQFCKHPVNRVSNSSNDDVNNTNVDSDNKKICSNDNYSRMKQLVYLTSDADEVLESLDSDCAYIIGGIVDRNRHKHITFNKAKEQGIRTAKLPIKDYFKLAATHVLTVNHVFEILLAWNASKDWKIALESVIPARKNATLICTQNKDLNVNESETVNLAEEQKRYDEE